MAKKKIVPKKQRYDIRISDIPEDLFLKISDNADKNIRFIKEEVLVFLIKNYK